MTERTRAWRRRQTRTAKVQIAKTKNWLKDQFKSPEKQHRHGALTHLQEMKLRSTLFDDASEAFLAT